MRGHLEKKVQEYSQMLERERQEKDALQRAQLHLITQGSAKQDSEFRSLADVIQEMRNDKAKISQSLKQKEVQEIQYQTQVHNQQIMLDGLKLQLKKEQDLRVQLQHMIDEMVLSQHQVNSEDKSALNAQDQQNLEKINEELKSLLLSQKESNELELASRDKLITDLQNLLNDLNHKLELQTQRFEEGVKKLQEE